MDFPTSIAVDLFKSALQQDTNLADGYHDDIAMRISSGLPSSISHVGKVLLADNMANDIMQNVFGIHPPLHLDGGAHDPNESDAYDAYSKAEELRIGFKSYQDEDGILEFKAWKEEFVDRNIKLTKEQQLDKEFDEYQNLGGTLDFKGFIALKEQFEPE